MISYEFRLLFDVVDVIEKKVDLTEEEVEVFRENYPDVYLIPKSVKKEVEEVVKKDAEIKYYIPDITNVPFKQHIDSRGKLFKDRFIIEINGKDFIVKGNYTRYKKFYEENTKRKINGY
jgi:hypothetical protein